MKTFTNYQQIVHTVFTNAKYTIIRKKEREENKMKTIKDYNGNNIDFEAAVMLMDDEIREQLHGMGIEDEQEFYNAYCEKHYEKYNEEFEI